MISTPSEGDRRTKSRPVSHCASDSAPLRLSGRIDERPGRRFGCERRSQRRCLPLLRTEIHLGQLVPHLVRVVTAVVRVAKAQLTGGVVTPTLYAVVVEKRAVVLGARR